MSAANGVKTIRLEQLDFALFGAVDRPRPERAIVVMDAAAFKLEHFSVEQETTLGIHFDFTNTKRGSNDIRDSTLNDDFHLGGIQGRRVDRPPLRRLHFNSLLRGSGCVPFDHQLAFGAIDDIPLGVSHPRADDRSRSRIGRVAYFDRDFDKRLVHGNFRSRHKHATHRHMDRIGNRQPSVAINARTGIPATVAAFIANAYRDHVWVAAWLQVRRKIPFKTRVTVGMFAQSLAVDPYFGIHVNPIEANGHSLVRFIHRKLFPIPTDAADGVAREMGARAFTRVKRADARCHCTRARVFLGRQIFDTPIVRHIELTPRRIIKSRVLRARCVASKKTPVAVKRSIAHDSSNQRSAELREGKS